MDLETFDRTDVSRSGLQTDLAELFRKEYGDEPKWFASAPGRVNLIGEHIDYNDGYVLPMAIERYVVMAASPRSGATRADANLYSVNLRASAKLQLQPPIQKTELQWPNYVQGVIAGGVQRGWNLRPLNIAFVSNVPPGSGLSSSAAIEVATATLLEAITNKTIPPVEKALLCQKAEHDFAGVPCGIMDQFSSTLCRRDHLMLLDCKSQEFEHVPFVADDVQVVIANTNVSHQLDSGEYAQRRQECCEAAKVLGVDSLRDANMEQLDQAKFSDVLFRRARHVVSEIQRTISAAEALHRGDLITMGQLMYASHASLRDDYEVSCDELDCLVRIAAQIGFDGGVYGSRMTGGGFGGCTVSLVKTPQVNAFCELLADQYNRHAGIEATIFATRPAAGARVLTQL